MTTPMNISVNGKNNYCDEKCAYSSNYQTTNMCTAVNYGYYLYLNYIDPGTTPPVQFNSNNYNVENIEIYSPSLHNFNGTQTAGELIITHTPVNVGKTLMICIPLSNANTATNDASTLITDIISAAVDSPLNVGDSAITINLDNFSLNNIVPKSQFFFYTDSNNNNIIVYGLADAIIINQTVINSLQKIIVPASDVIFPSVDYYYMSKGGLTGLGSDGDGSIYIDCQPTGNSTEIEQVTYNKSSSSATDLKTLVNSPFFQIIIGVIIFTIFILVISAGFNFLSAKS